MELKRRFLLMYLEKEEINIVIVVEVGAVEMCINLQVVEIK